MRTALPFLLVIGVPPTVAALTFPLQKRSPLRQNDFIRLKI
jgi:hypothetical protein